MDDKLQQVLHKVELLCEQNPEFDAALREKLGVAQIVNDEVNVVNSESDSFSSAMRLQHQRCRSKARSYYAKIADEQLRQNLINDHAKMLWYKSIFEVGQYFVHVNYQAENMLNYYLSHTDFHKKVAAEPIKYCKKIEINPKYTISIDAYTYAFDKNKGNSPIDPPRINSLWVKFLYWAIDTDQEDILERFKTYLNAIVSVRNEVNHANSSS